MIKIYGTDGCSYCSAAFKLAQESGESMAYIYIDRERAAMEELTEKIGPFRTVPQIFINDHHIGGYQEFRKYMNNED